MEAANTSILIINSGSSSIKFSLYKITDLTKHLLHGELETNGTKNATLHFTNIISNQKNSIDIKSAGYDNSINFLITWLEKQDEFVSIVAVGHRIVHGMKHTEPEKITPELLDELKKISAFDPEHLPQEIKLIELFQKHYPAIQQIACFDTSFHTSIAMVAKLLPIPRKYFSMGIQRYGFHGLSYSYLMEELDKLTGNKVGKEKIILAHLGNGASIAAIKNGKSIDTSMSFTPTAGIPMSTRTGDLDPGVAWYLMHQEKMSAKQFNYLINHESGLLGISETNSDMRELLKLQAIDTRAADAIDIFCYQTKKYIGAYAAALGGLNRLVFSGGIGENAPEIRERICSSLKFLGVELDKKRNGKNKEIISSDNSSVTVHVIKTNEELMIAKLVCDVLKIEH
ncbi:MAG TPA: acetate/propionate family kinase [Puia sp.]|jgi:acetate kinase|nr:acetate/propionate family kinase [Puia sp.]